VVFDKVSGCAWPTEQARQHEGRGADRIQVDDLLARIGTAADRLDGGDEGVGDDGSRVDEGAIHVPDQGLQLVGGHL
jgi:hypothetical protein